MKNFSIALLAILVLQQSCKPTDDIVPASQFSNGIYVINEGTFPNGDGALTFKNFNDNTVTEDLYKQKTGVSLGLLPQSVSVIDDKVNICVTNSNKFYRANTSDFTTYPGVSISSPRYALNINASKIYISDWGNGLSTATAGVNVFSKSGIVEKRIATDPGAEEMVANGNRVYVTCNGGFGKNKTINVIDTDRDSVVAKIAVGPNPDGIVKDINNNLWILCTGEYDANFNLINPGKLVKYTTLTNTVTDAFIFNSPFSTPANLKINPSGNTLFMNFDGKIHKMDITTSAPQVFAKGYYYGLAVDNNGDVYASDPKDYVSKGQVKRFSNDGVLRDSFATSIVPSEILIYRK
jgi:hypothetical protein